MPSSQPMTSPRVSRIESAAADLFAKQKVEAVPEYFLPDYTVHHTGGTLQGHAPILAFLDAVHRAFPQLQVQVEVLVEGDDRIAWRRRLQGVQHGALQGFPATGKEVVWHDLVVTR